MHQRRHGLFRVASIIIYDVFLSDVNATAKTTVMTVLVITVLINMMLHINERFAVDIFFVTAIHCHVAVIATVNLLRIFGGVCFDFLRVFLLCRCKVAW